MRKLMASSDPKSPKRRAVLGALAVGLTVLASSCGQGAETLGSQSADPSSGRSVVDQSETSQIEGTAASEPATSDSTTSVPTTEGESTTTTSEAAPEVVSDVEWGEYVSVDGGYTIILPVEGRTNDTQIIPSEVGELTFTLVSVTIDNERSYAANHTDYPAGVAIDLDSGVAGAVNGALPGGQVTRNEEVTVSGYACREYAGEGAVQGTNAVVAGVLCEVANNRVVQLIAVGMPGLDDLPETRSFLDSLSIQ